MVPASLIYFLNAYRYLWIGGRVGYGKSLLAYAIWYEAFRDYPLIANFRAKGASDLSSLSGPRAFYILDEAGNYLEKDIEIKAIFRNARKLDYYVLLPSFLPPPSLARQIGVFPAGSLRSIGLPVDFWLMRAELGPWHYQEKFSIFLREQYYGFFDTLSPSSDPGEIINFLAKANRIFLQEDSRDVQGRTFQAFVGSGSSLIY